ncbi:MAG TPA: DnaJ domain-containing protein [Terrimesophilobacter sp.]|nr:DnaJ domain-containing protein [Terrimesophilobacter sp.]
MPDSPASPTPYEILGVAADASHAELRRAYRRLLRETHPDTGGDPARFQAVQDAWTRIGDTGTRARWDRGRPAAGPGGSGAASGPARRSAPSSSSPRARAYGHPGGYSRERFLVLMREWAGRGATLDDPYDPALVRSAPRELRHLLADALAEEATVRAVSGLGIGYTIWSDVATGRGKLDHVILGPAGLFAVMSEDWGSPIRLVRGELDGEGLTPGTQPVRDLAHRAKSLGREVRVRFTAMLIVVPDDHLAEPVSRIGRKNDAAIVRLSVLPMVLRDGLGGGQRLSIEDVFDVRTRLQHGIRFV